MKKSDPQTCILICLATANNPKWLTSYQMPAIFISTSCVLQRKVYILLPVAALLRYDAFEPVAVAVVEGGEVLAVYVEHGDDAAVAPDGNDDFAA